MGYVKKKITMKTNTFFYGLKSFTFFLGLSHGLNYNSLLGGKHLVIGIDCKDQNHDNVSVSSGSSALGIIIFEYENDSENNKKLSYINNITTKKSSNITQDFQDNLDILINKKMCADRAIKWQKQITKFNIELLTEKKKLKQEESSLCEKELEYKQKELKFFQDYNQEETQEKTQEAIDNYIKKKKDNKENIEIEKNIKNIQKEIKKIEEKIEDYSKEKEKKLIQEKWIKYVVEKYINNDSYDKIECAIENNNANFLQKITEKMKDLQNEKLEIYSYRAKGGDKKKRNDDLIKFFLDKKLFINDFLEEDISKNIQELKQNNDAFDAFNLGLSHYFYKNFQSIIMQRLTQDNKEAIIKEIENTNNAIKDFFSEKNIKEYPNNSIKKILEEIGWTNDIDHRYAISQRFL